MLDPCPAGGNNYLGGGGNDTYIISPYSLSGAVTASSLSYAQFAAALGASVPATGASAVSGSANFVVP